MNALNAIVWGIIGAVAGIAIGTELGPLFGWRHMEGMSAYFGLMFGSPVGCIAGGVFGYRQSRGYGDDTKKRGNFLFLTCLAAGALIAGTVIFEKIRTQDHLDPSLSITSYIRLPAGAAVPDKNTRVVFELRSDKETQKSSPYSEPDWSVKDGRPQMQESIDIYRATTDRTMAVRIGDGPTYLFKLKAPARPKVYSYEGPWQKPDAIEGAGSLDGMELRALM